MYTMEQRYCYEIIRKFILKFENKTTVKRQNVIVTRVQKAFVIIQIDVGFETSFGLHYTASVEIVMEKSS